MVSVKNNLKVQRTPVETGTVDLSVSGPHARTLLMILDRVGGDPAESARIYADDIRFALDEALKWKDRAWGNSYGGISFTDESKAIVETIE